MRRFFPLLAAITMLWLLLWWMVAASMSHNAGRLIYALDDAYIHMAVAKNLAAHGVFGVTQHSFSASSSSPLWTLILSLFFLLFGARESLPFILNAMAATGILILAFFILEPRLSSRMWLAAILVFLAMAAPLPGMVMVGMEHTLHTLLALAFVALAVRVLSEPPTQTRPAAHTVSAAPAAQIMLPLLAALAVAARFESLFLVVPVGALLLLRRRPGLAAASVGSAFLPILILGVVQKAYGWFFLPASILVKSRDVIHSPTLSETLSRGAVTLFGRPLLLFLATASVLVLGRHLIAARRDGFENAIWRNPTAIWFAVLLPGLLLHALMAKTGFLFRYQVYLIVCGLVGIAGAMDSLVDSATASPASSPSPASPVSSPSPTSPAFSAFVVVGLTVATVAAFAAGQPLPQRTQRALKATGNIYRQQYQMGLFLKRFYPGKAVVANDIGAIDYLADIKLLDLAGLGSKAPLQARLDRRVSTDSVSRFTRRGGADIAIVYDKWAPPGGFPRDWVAVRRWRIPGNVVCASDTVTFYSLKSWETERLDRRLGKFRAALPAGVRELPPP